jgi:hypothetical protein
MTTSLILVLILQQLIEAAELAVASYLQITAILELFI